VKTDTLGIPLLSSLAIHVFVIVVASLMFNNNQLRRSPDFLPIGLFDVPRPENSPAERIEAPPENKLAPPTAKRTEQPKNPPAPKVDAARPEQLAAPLPAPLRQEPAKMADAQPAAPTETETPPALSSGSDSEGGGSEAGAGTLSGRGDVGIVPGAGTAGGSGGTALSGLGLGSGAPGVPGQTAPIKTNRLAQPIQTVRASYPPMALRMGLESDVALKIEIDPEGKVTKADIVKSGGAAFDEEAVKAVKQTRFEPANKDGRNVPAEFMYVYRFRLRK
jgi:periplasmic protein TonB